MNFGSFDSREKGSTNKRISSIHDDCEESCNNKNVHRGIQVPQEPVGRGLPGFAYIYDTTEQVLPIRWGTVFKKTTSAPESAPVKYI